jgi:hypothetical protein
MGQRSARRRRFRGKDGDTPTLKLSSKETLDHQSGAGYRLDMNEARRALGQALSAKLGCGPEDWCTAPGGGYSIKGKGLFSVAKAREVTGIAAETKPVRPVSQAANEFNMLCSLVHAVSRGSRGAAK